MQNGRGMILENENIHFSKVVKNNKHPLQQTKE
jgi:hypothetical protein